MITADDVRFHIPNEMPYDWAETNYFSIYIAEANVTAWVYTIARPGVGAFVADVEVIDRIGRNILDAVYVDFAQHLPMPERLENYSLPNGLSLTTFNEPKGYSIDYVGVQDTELHLKVEGLMAPYDIHDPDMDPLASVDPNQSGFGSAYSNHFDMTAHVTGTAKIRGREYKVDCVTTMDHSWGPRNERTLRPMAWINGNFDANFAFHAIWHFDPTAEGWDQFRIAHGYILVDGEVRGLVDGRFRATRDGPFPMGMEQVLIDHAGREYRFTGITVAQHPWGSYSSCLATFSTVRWLYEDREGYGLSQENWPVNLLGRFDRDR